MGLSLHIADRTLRVPRRRPAASVMRFRDSKPIRFTDTDFLSVERLGPQQSLSPEGFLIIQNVPLARTGPQLYSDQEIPLQGDSRGRIVIDREPDEVFRPATVASLNGKAVTLDHPDEDVDPSNYKQLLVGTVINPRRGQNALDNLLIGDLIIYDQNAIKAIRRREVREVSVGYKADYEETGIGRGRQRNILCNHLALVRDGRCGPVCRIGDKAYFARHDEDCSCDQCEHMKADGTGIYHTDAEWHEEQHKRDKSGEFSTTGGGGGAREEKPEETPAATAHNVNDFKAAGFNLNTIPPGEQQRFLDAWNKDFRADPAAFKKALSGGVENSSMEVERVGDDGYVFHGVLGANRRNDPNARGEYGFHLDPAKGYSEFALLKLNPNEQGKGLAKQMLRSAVKQIEDLGISKVSIHANIDVGGYSWARYGWAPTEAAWSGQNGRPGLRDKLSDALDSYDHYNPGEMSSEDKTLLRKLFENDDPKTLWAIADSKYGKKLLLDRGWRGSLDLHDPQAHRRLMSYLGDGGGGSLPKSTADAAPDDIDRLPVTRDPDERRGRFLYYQDPDGTPRDAALHAEIMAGEHDDAIEASRELLKELGLSASDIDAFLEPSNQAEDQQAVSSDKELRYSDQRTRRRTGPRIHVHIRR